MSVARFVRPAAGARAVDRLASLATALDAERAKDFLAPFVRARLGPDASIRRVDVTFYRRHLKRCLVRYRAEVLAGGQERSWGVVGKVVEAEAGKALERMRELRDAGFSSSAADGISIPDPLGLVPELSMVIQEDVPGETLRERLARDPEPALLRLAGRALAKLHRARLRPRPARGVAQHLQRCHPRHWFLASAFPDLADAIEGVVRRAFEIEAALGSIDATPIHGDFHLGQVLVADGRAWLIDFDALGRGDPASDVANLIVPLKDKARRDPRLAVAIEEFLAGYDMDPSIVRRVPLFESLTRLRQACKALRVQGPGWRERARAAIEEAIAAIAKMEDVAGGERPLHGPIATTRSDAARGLRGLSTGQRVKVKGAARDECFLALEVKPRVPEGPESLEGLLQDFDVTQRAVSLLGRRIALPVAVQIIGPGGMPGAITDLTRGARVRIVGIARSEGFVPTAIRIKDAREFAIDKLEGAVERVDVEAGVFHVAGFAVATTPETSFVTAPRSDAS
jgi:aminoglycoside phosphotransferase (APT) family kinase protein